MTFQTYRKLAPNPKNQDLAWTMKPFMSRNATSNADLSKPLTKKYSQMSQEASLERVINKVAAKRMSSKNINTLLDPRPR